MVRFWFGVGLMALLLATGLFGSWAMDTSHEPIAQALEQAAVVTDQAQASDLLHNARQDWEHHWKATAVLAAHDAMDEIDSLFALADAYADSDQTADLRAACQRLAQLIRASVDDHKATWWNFL